MKLNAIQHALLLSLLPTTSAFAAALDRSGQSIAPFLQAGNYFEAGISVLDPNVSGKTKDNYPFIGSPISNASVGEMAESYQTVQAALKLQVTDQFSFGLFTTNLWLKSKIFSNSRKTSKHITSSCCSFSRTRYIP
jgi:long-chain fatty acid transport protein